LREAGGEETSRFEATLVREGVDVALVSNGGTGGSHLYRWIDGVEQDRFEQAATEWNAAGEFAGLEDGDQLVNRFIECSALSRMRKTPFLLGTDGSFWETGQCRQLDRVVDRETLVAWLHREHPSARVWDAAAGDFVRVG